MPITLNGTTGITTPGLINTGSTTFVDLTTTGNTILGDASTDTLNVANGNLVLNSSGNAGLSVTPSAWGGGYKAIQISPRVGLFGNSNDSIVGNNLFNDGTNWKYIASATGALYLQGSGIHAWYQAASGTAGATASLTQAMTLDASGNLLVGVTSASYSSSNRGVINVGGSSGGLLALSSSTNKSYLFQSGADLLIENDTASGNLIFGTASSTERARIDSSGNLLVGSTSSPATVWSGNRTFSYVKGNTAGNSGEVIVESNNGNQQASFFASAITAEFGLWSTKASALLFGTNNAERARIDSSGRMQIGTTSAGYSATLTLLSAANSYNLTSSRLGAGTGSLGHVVFETDSGAVGTIFTNGASTSYNTSSDYRLKHTIAPMTGALAKVAQLKPVTYKWNFDGSDGEGFIAHELAEVVPQAVTGAKDAVDEEGNPQYQGIDVSFLVATLTAAIQELKSELDSVKTELAALKGN